MNSIIRIGTRESELAIWQANLVKEQLSDKGYASTLVYIKSEGDIDLKTPLYEMGVQGIFTRSLDTALINNSIDIAVHSMKDVPTQLPQGIVQAAVLKRGNYKDLFVPNKSFTELVGSTNTTPANRLEEMPHNKFDDFLDSLRVSSMTDYSIIHPSTYSHIIIGTSSIRRRAQWLHHYPKSKAENLRGNINTRLKKLAESDWTGAVFAAAGLERINLRPKNSIELDWMLPAPAQGAIIVVCRNNDDEAITACFKLNDDVTATCTKIERGFLRHLLGGCSTPISALAQFDKNEIFFKGNMLSPDGKEKIEIEKFVKKEKTIGFGRKMAIDLLKNGGQEILCSFSNE